MDKKVDDVDPRPLAPDLRPESRPRRRRWIWLVLLLLIAAGGAAVWFRASLAPTAQPSAQAGRGGRRFGGRQGLQPQPVAVAAVTHADIPVVLNALGTVTSLATVNVRSQISGQLTEIGFTEGQMVKKGDFLAQVDPAPYKAALEQLQGQIERDQALLENARLDLARYQKLSTENSVAKQTVDTQRATVSADEGTVRADQGLIDAQKINLANCRIVSPIDGRAGLRQVDAGNYVQANDTTGIVVITQLQPISVVFSLPEDDLPEIMAERHNGVKLSVALFDRSGATQIATGELASLDNQIDPTTGTIKLRALFPNADEALFPNQFVNARLLVRTVKNALVVPVAAVQHGAPGTFVFVVGADDKVAVRPIKTGPADVTQTSVVSGLALGDRVVTDGTDRLKDGAKVVVPAAAGAAGPAADAAARRAAYAHRGGRTGGAGRGPRPAAAPSQ